MTAIALDIGGSMQHLFPRMKQRLKEMTFPYRVVLFDYRVVGMRVMHSPTDVDILFREMPTGGGTDFRGVIEVLETAGNTDALIFYSDGQGPGFTRVWPEFPIAWAAEFLEDLPPFGEICD